MAQGIPDSTIEEIKSRIDLADLISSYGVQVRRAGASYKACCPFHHEKTPSFNIQPDRGFYHCFGCGESGDAIKFVEKQEGLTFVEAVRKLGARCGVTVEEKEDPSAGLRKRLLALHAELAAFYHRCLLEAKEAAKARAYLEERALAGEPAERFSIGYAPVSAAAMLKWAEKYRYRPEELSAAGILLPPRFPGGNWYNRFAGRLVFPVKDKMGRVVAFSCRTLETDKAKMRGGKYVNSPETPIFRKSDVLYALDQAAGNIVNAPGRGAIVCEGQIDVIRCHACGFNTAVAGQGTAFTAEHVQLLRRCADSVTLVFDADGAGQKAGIRTGGLFLAAEMPVRVATLPEGEDPDSLLRRQGPEAFKKCLDEADSIIAFQIRALRGQEANPSSIDAVTRISRAVLETVALCPSAIIRSSLMAEAAKILGLPVSALEEDLAQARNKVKTSSARNVAPPEPATLPETADREAPDQGEELPDSLDAAAPVNNPPPPRELALCETLFVNEHSAPIMAMLRECVPPALLTHEFTRAFVAAYLDQMTSGRDEFALLRESLSPVEVRWLDAIFMADAKTALTELEPEQVLQELLRQLWQAAILRLQGALEAASSEENDRRRLNYSMLARKFKQGSWAAIKPLMRAETLENC